MPRQGWRYRWAFALAGFLLASQARAAGADRVVRLSYERGAGVDGCPTEEVVRQVVTGHLGRDPFDPRASQILRASVERLENGLRARIQLTENGRILGQSDVTSSTQDCEELGFSMMLALSIAIDPLVALRLPAPDPEPPRDDEPPAPTASRTVSPPRARTGLALGLGGHVASGLGASTTLGAALRARLRRAVLSLGLDLRWDPPSSRDLSGGELDTSAVVGTGVACWHVGRFAGCGVLGGGALRIAGRELGEPSNVRYKPLAVIGPRVTALAVSWRALSLGAHAEWLGAPLKTTVKIDDEPVWALPRNSFTGGLTLYAEIP